MQVNGLFRESNSTNHLQARVGAKSITEGHVTSCQLCKQLLQPFRPLPQPSGPGWLYQYPNSPGPWALSLDLTSQPVQFGAAL